MHLFTHTHAHARTHTGRYRLRLGQKKKAQRIKRLQRHGSMTADFLISRQNRDAGVNCLDSGG